MFRWFRFLAASLLLIAVQLACGGKGPVAQFANPATKPIIHTFGSNSQTLIGGSSATLSWNVEGATSLTLEPFGDVSLNSACFIVPTATTTYRLVATNALGETSATTTVQLSGLAPAYRTDHQRLLEDLRKIASPLNEGRALGTPGNARARAFLMDRLSSLGLSPFGDGFEQPWVDPSRGLRGINLVGQLRGSTYPDQVILVCGHYDHIGATTAGLVQGADDNASGAAAVLQAASYFKTHPPAHTMIFALFDGEERGLLGSKAMVELPPVPLSQFQLVVNLDMISRADYGKLGVIGTASHVGIRPTITQSAAEWEVPVEFGHEDLMPYSDQWYFHQKGIPTVFFCCVDHPDYHTPRDTYERISPDYYRKAVETALGTLVRMDGLSPIPALAPRHEERQNMVVFGEWTGRPARFNQGLRPLLKD